MGAVYGSESIVSKQVFAVDVEQFFDAERAELLVFLANGFVFGDVSCAAFREPASLIDDIFDEYDGCVGFRFSQAFHEGGEPFVDEFGVHVGEAIEDVYGGIEFCE